jgi:hypothetical protein
MSVEMNRPQAGGYNIYEIALVTRLQIVTRFFQCGALHIRTSNSSTNAVIELDKTTFSRFGVSSRLPRRS